MTNFLLMSGGSYGDPFSQATRTFDQPVFDTYQADGMVMV
jgi:hypothetical protein